ncbi:hypothetical protein JCM3765_007076 [Sporobolomyces pararoseus]
MTSPNPSTPPAALPPPENPSNKQLLGSTPPPEHQEQSTAQHVDDLFRKWTRYISHKLKNKKPSRKTEKDNDDGTPPLDLSQPLEIQRSVIADQVDEGSDRELKVEDEGGSRKNSQTGRENRLETLDHKPPLSHEAFLGLISEARSAILQGIHPRLNSKGSSGSYFVRDPSDSTTIGIFKPSDEDPYGAMNPKLLKYIHRSLHHFAPRLVPFGRSCLIPGQSYLSESAASVLDRKLESWIVPRTEVVGLTSKAFYYDWIERERAKKDGQELREKDGSFQVFLKGFTDASDFLAKHPYPTTARALSYSKSPRSSLFSTCLPCCGSSAFDDSSENASTESHPSHPSSPEFEWTPGMVESFQLELEKLVILDYLIRNTDRGLDNFMIKPCIPSALSPCPSSPSSTTTLPASSNTPERPHLHIAAIDNSLAFPHTHPQGWRTYPYGWLYLPLPLLDNPWSEKTRSHYLSKLEDSSWWSELHRDLREEFRQGSEWDEEDEQIWKKQWSVVKGQGWNLVRSLREPKEGPLELCRRKKVLVWDDLVLVSEKDDTQQRQEPNSLPAPLLTPPIAPSVSSVSVSYSRASKMTAKPPLTHRRTLSDYTPTYGSTSKMTRPNLISSSSADRRTASFLRKPLDALASSPKKPFKNLLLRHHSSSSSSSSMSRLREASETGDRESDEEDEGEEETGFTFLKKLDKLEAVEQKRARKVEKEAKKLGLLREDRDSTRKRKGIVRSRSEEENGRIIDERSHLLTRSDVSDDEDEEAGEGIGWGTTSEIILNGNGRVPAKDSGRLSMSWYGGENGDRSSLGIEGVLSQAERGREDRECRIGKKWVVHERLEHVQEPKRRLRLPW